MAKRALKPFPDSGRSRDRHIEDVARTPEVERQRLLDAAWEVVKQATKNDRLWSPDINEEERSELLQRIVIGLESFDDSELSERLSGSGRRKMLSEIGKARAMYLEAEALAAPNDTVPSASATEDEESFVPTSTELVSYAKRMHARDESRLKSLTELSGQVSVTDSLQERGRVDVEAEQIVATAQSQEQDLEVRKRQLSDYAAEMATRDAVRAEALTAVFPDTAQVAEIGRHEDRQSSPVEQPESKIDAAFERRLQDIRDDMMVIQTAFHAKIVEVGDINDQLLQADAALQRMFAELDEAKEHGEDVAVIDTKVRDALRDLRRLQTEIEVSTAEFTKAEVAPETILPEAPEKESDEITEIKPKARSRKRSRKPSSASLDVTQPITVPVVAVAKQQSLLARARESWTRAMSYIRTGWSEAARGTETGVISLEAVRQDFIRAWKDASGNFENLDPNRALAVLSRMVDSRVGVGKNFALKAGALDHILDTALKNTNAFDSRDRQREHEPSLEIPRWIPVGSRVTDRHDGVVQILQRVIKASPEHFGYSDDQDLELFAKGLAVRLANRDGLTRLWITDKSVDRLHLFPDHVNGQLALKAVVDNQEIPVSALIDRGYLSRQALK